MTFRHPFRRGLAQMFCCALVCALAPSALAQIFPDDTDVPGIWIEQDGNVRSRKVDADRELAAIRQRAKSAAQAAKGEKLSFVSLPRSSPKCSRRCSRAGRSRRTCGSWAA
jgi:hypothetical protein